MKSYLALTWKELKTQKITATLILIAVIMSTIITTVVGQSIGILQSMRIEQAASLNGNRYVTFHQLSREQAQKLHEDDRVYDVGDTRVNEIGMQRAIGMSAASLYKTFLWEGAYYAIFASVIGAVLGYVCCIFVGAAKTDALQLVAVPVIAIIEAAVVSVAACLLATAIPLHSIAKMNIVETIENIE